MRSGKYCIYKGVEYSVGKTDNVYVNLISTNAEELNNGFFPKENAPELLIKRVKKDLLSRYFRVYSYGVYKGYKFQIIGTKGNQTVLCTSDERIADECGFIMMGLRDYKKLIDTKEVKVFEEEVDY